MKNIHVHNIELIRRSRKDQIGVLLFILASISLMLCLIISIVIDYNSISNMNDLLFIMVSIFLQIFTIYIMKRELDLPINLFYYQPKDDSKFHLYLYNRKSKFKFGSQYKFGFDDLDKFISYLDEKDKVYIDKFNRLVLNITDDDIIKYKLSH